MTKIESFFNGVRSFSGDIWVADYTNKTNLLPKGQRRGVVFGDKEPNNIKSFHLQEDNIAINANSAYDQLMDTWRLLYGNGFYDKRHCKIFFNISIPEHDYSIAPPFEGFIGNQDERIEFRKKYKIYLFGVNNILVVNSGILQAVASPI